MLVRRYGDIFTTTLSVVIPVNTRGTLGAGLALQAAKRWPEMVESYRRWCYLERRSGGDCEIWCGDPCRDVIWCATKESWREPSRLEWVARALDQLGTWADEGHEMALPLLGAGLGRLSPEQVGDMIERRFRIVPAEIELWQPTWPRELQAA